MSRIAHVGNNSKFSTFTKPLMIQVNGVGISAIGLCDTGADTRLLVSPQTAVRAQDGLRARIVKLKTPIQLRDYREKQAGVITTKMIATLEIDGRRFPNETFLVTECGHDVFVGQH